MQTLDQDIVECVRVYGLWAEQPALADIVNAEDTGKGAFRLPIKSAGMEKFPW